MNTYWWFRPSHIAIFVVMPIACFAYNASEGFYQKFGAFNAITGDRFFPVWLSILGFAGASWLAEVVQTRRSPAPAARLGEGQFTAVIFGLIFIGTVATLVLLYPLLTNPALLIRIMNDDPGAVYVARASADKIPGFTSLENFFPVVVVMLIAKRRITGNGRTLADTLMLTFVLSLTALKVVLYSERLALIEMLVPVALLTGALRRRSGLWAVAPVAGVAALFFFFMLTESLRSWAFHANGGTSLFEFALDRMIGYYMTAINNGAFVYGEGHSYIFPIWSAGWLWRLPIPGFSDYLASVTGASTDLTELLSGLNVEYNNTSGIYAPLIDFGPVLGIFVWICLGLVSGRLFRLFKDGHCLGLILFPTWFVGVLEIPRVFYWGDSRYIPPAALSLAIAFVMLYLRPSAAPRRRPMGARTAPAAGVPLAIRTPRS